MPTPVADGLVLVAVGAVAGHDHFQYRAVFELVDHFVDRNDVAEQFFRQNGSVRNNVEVFDFRLHQRGIVTERFKRLRGNALVGLSGTAGLKRQCRVTNAFGHNVSPLKKCFLLFTAYEVIGGPPFSSAAYTKDIKTKRRPLPLIFRI